MGREKRHRTALFSALKGIAALFSTTAPLMHIPADSEQEVALIPSICSIFICLVVDTDGEKFPGSTMEGIPGGGRTDLEIYRATWGWMPAKTVLRDSSLMDTRLWVGTSVWWRREVSMRQAKPPLNHGGNGGLLSETYASQTLLWGAPHAACTFVREDGHHDLSFKPSFPCVYTWCARVTVRMWRSEANLLVLSFHLVGGKPSWSLLCSPG